MTEIKLRQAGGSISATLPKELVARFGLHVGDTVFAIQTDEGILLTPINPKTKAVLEAASETMREYREALNELAK